MIRTFIDLAPRGRGPCSRSDARRHAQGWWSRSSRQSRSSLGSCSSQVDPPATHRNAAPAHADRGDPRGGPIDLDVEDAWAFDLEVLLDSDAAPEHPSYQLLGVD